MKILGIAASAAALALTLNVATPNVAAAQTTPDAANAAPNELAEVIVTGTRRLDRTVAESSAPIDVITGTDLTNYPAASMLDTLSNLVPSFIVGQNSISDASSFVRSPSLRGLPADEMLVMLNGKRMNRSALVQVYQGGETELAFGSQGPDLNSIPSIAVKSLEILRDGASAQYGSDAIAGVLNYQFRTNSSGIQVDGRYGKYFPSGFPRDGGDGLLAANVGLPLGSQGFVNFSAEWAKSEQTIRNPTRPSALAFAQTFPESRSAVAQLPGSRAAVGNAALRQRQDLLEFRHQARQWRSGLLLHELRQYSDERELQLSPAGDRHRLDRHHFWQPSGLQQHFSGSLHAYADRLPNGRLHQ